MYFRWQPATASHVPSSTSSQVPTNVATTTDLENLKKELTNVMQNEIAAAKQEILDGWNCLLIFAGILRFKFTLWPIISHVKDKMINPLILYMNAAKNK
jgi:hypothetical protein